MKREFEEKIFILKGLLAGRDSSSSHSDGSLEEGDHEEKSKREGEPAAKKIPEFSRER